MYGMNVWCEEGDGLFRWKEVCSRDRPEVRPGRGKVGRRKYCCQMLRSVTFSEIPSGRGEEQGVTVVEVGQTKKAVAVLAEVADGSPRLID